MSHVKNSPGLLLHAAIKDNNLEECLRLLQKHGKKASVVKNSSGTTPLMEAANGGCGKENNSQLVEALLAAGANESAAERSKKGRTAADIAEARGANALAKRLRALEKEATKKEHFARCKICQAKLRRRSKLEFVRDTVLRGEETNPLLLELFQGDENSSATIKSLSRPEFHRINSCIALRKELSESMALISELKRLRRCGMNVAKEGCSTAEMDKENDDSRTPVSWERWHVIDLCSGSSVTASLMLHLLPGIAITAVDMVDPDKLPHIQAAGFGRRSFTYLKSDIYDETLVTKLRQRTQEIITQNNNENVTTVIFGMHCCGLLSLRAIEIFQQTNADSAFLMPCCLPPKSGTSERIEKAIYETTDQAEQYQRWAIFLRQTLSSSGKERCVVETNLNQVRHVMSPRNALITGVVNSRRKQDDNVQ